MAKKILKEIECPNCKEKAELQMWDSINVSLNADLKEKIKNGTIFDWHCPHCGKTVRVLYPFLYIDMLNTFMIWFGAEGQCSPELYQTMDLTGYQFRNARTFNELVEKAAIFENHLDDHALEILKFSIVQTLYKRTEGGKTGPLPALMFFREKQDEEEALLLSVLYQKAPGQLMRVAMSSYEVIRKDLDANPSIAKGLADGEGRFQTVDFQWAKNAVEILAAQKKAQG